MTEQRVCKTCGTPADDSVQFCTVCDTYLGWSVNADAAAPRKPGAPPPPGGPPREPGPGGGQPPRGPRDRVVAPVASVKQVEVTLSASAPATFEVDVKNDSSIVDSFTIHAADPPPWLTVTHGEVNLLPGVLRTVTVTLAIAPGVLAVAQRVTVPLLVRSGVDAARATPLSIGVTIPKSGPAATLVARPNLIRLVDTVNGSLQLHLDNRAANFARRYELTGTDPEGVVRVEFVPRAVDVPAGGTAEATVRFTAPPPAPGKDLSRQLTLTATDPDGQVAVTVTLDQSTSPPPESLPARLRLEPAEVTLFDRTSAEINVVLDNRGGHELVKFNLSGRDPGNEVGFRFEHNRVAVSPGSLGYVRLVVETAPVMKGSSDTRPFTVVATADDGREVEAAGSLEVASHPDPIGTAKLYIQPEHLAVRGRKGTFAVDVDNRQGSEALQVQMSGSDEFGQARMSFQPSVLVVPPGQVARCTAVVEHARPEGGTTSTRQVQIAATSASGSVNGRATFTQQADSYRRLWAILLVLLGVVVIALAVIGWATDDTVRESGDAVNRLVTNASDSTTPLNSDIAIASITALVGLIGISGVLMLLGLIGTGRLVRASAIFAALCAGGIAAASPISRLVGQDTGIALNPAAVIFAVAGAAIAFIGGVLLKR